MGFTVWFKELGLEDYSEKVELLRKAGSHGLAMPPGFVIPDYVFQMFAKQARLDEHLPYLFAGKETAAQKAFQMQAILRNEPLMKELKEELAENYKAMCIEGKEVSVVVRGPKESILNVRGEKRLLAAVAEAWAFVFSENWFEKASHGTQIPKIDLLVQAQLFGRKSAHAEIHDGKGKVLVNYGIPLSVMEGNSDSLDYDHGILKPNSFGKNSALFADPLTGEMEKQAIPNDEKNTDVLTKAESELLGNDLVKLSEAVGPSDSIWTLVHGVWHLLAVRSKVMEVLRQENIMLPKHEEAKLLSVRKDWEKALDELKERFPESDELVERLRKRFKDLGGKQ